VPPAQLQQTLLLHLLHLLPLLLVGVSADQVSQRNWLPTRRYVTTPTPKGVMQPGEANLLLVGGKLPKYNLTMMSPD
jgi:hypothetical protein